MAGCACTWRHAVAGSPAWRSIPQQRRGIIWICVMCELLAGGPINNKVACSRGLAGNERYQDKQNRECKSYATDAGDGNFDKSAQTLAKAFGLRKWFGDNAHLIIRFRNCIECFQKPARRRGNLQLVFACAGSCRQRARPRSARRDTLPPAREARCSSLSSPAACGRQKPGQGQTAF